MLPTLAADRVLVVRNCVSPGSSPRAQAGRTARRKAKSLTSRGVFSLSALEGGVLGAGCIVPGSCGFVQVLCGQVDEDRGNSCSCKRVAHVPAAAQKELHLHSHQVMLSKKRDANRYFHVGDKTLSNHRQPPLFVGLFHNLDVRFAFVWWNTREFANEGKCISNYVNLS